MPVVLPPLTPPVVTGVLKYEWVDPTGLVHDLSYATSPNLFVVKGSVGLGAPPVDIATDKLPYSAGTIVRHVQTLAVEIELPIYATASTLGGLIDRIEELRFWFDTGDEADRRFGHLRITRPSDDHVREIACLYRGGLEGSMAEGGPNETVRVVTLYAPDPYWTDIVDTVETYDSADIGTSLGVVNAGDVDAFPIWRINGPATNIVLTNTATNRVLALTANGGITLNASDTLTIDTRPAAQRDTQPVTDQSGASYYSRIASGSALWWFGRGGNAFTIAAAGTTGATSIELRWRPRYRGALR